MVAVQEHNGIHQEILIALGFLNGSHEDLSAPSVTFSVGIFVAVS
jgi:hypothetical protein